MSDSASIALVVELIKQVKPGLADYAVSSEDSVDDLGLDSLDVLQLARKLNKASASGFDLDEWAKSMAGERRTVGSVAAAIAPAPVN
ncbi:acyl carrier protein [Streptomyces sp. NPDC005900]|uniref:acyl carrier protein n=1 Tax=Streptomyces sp. NPDC005900 TaxID=3154569 RepID=UPI0033D1B647